MKETTSDHRALLRRIFDAAVARAHPDHVLAQHLPEAPTGRIIILAAGKGAAAMAAVAEQHYLDTSGIEPARISGLATTRHGHRVATRAVEVIEAGHPVPDQASQAAALQTLHLAEGATENDLVLVLLSGGGSANWIAPVQGVSFAQKQALNRLLLRSGAPIDAMNAVRKHLSRIKGGRLARSARPARLVTLAISDVPRDDPAVIASGPTVPDGSTLQDARDVLKRFSIDADPAIIAALSNPDNESCKPDDPAFANAQFMLIARPRDSLQAAQAEAERAGYACITLGELEGEARDVARDHAQMARASIASNKKTAILSGGELTVTVKGSGRGGPNQEYALSLLNELGDLSGISTIAADTDGADGGGGSADDPAGAFADSKIAARAKQLGLNPAQYLANNDATGFFEQSGGLINTGPTLTNVNDVRVILIDPV
jgi:hydroxypyruvate reductase